MSALLYRLGRWSFRRRKAVVAFWLLALVGLVSASTLFSRPTVDGFTIPGTEAQDAMDALAHTFPETAGASAQLIVVVPEGRTVEEDPVRSVIEETAGELRSVDAVAGVGDPFAPEAAHHRADSGRAMLLPLQFDRPQADLPPEVLDELTAIAAQLHSVLPTGAEVSVGGEAFSAVEVPHDARGELLGLALALLVLLVTFGSLVAAGLPMVVAVIGVGISLTAIEVATSFVEVSDTAPVLATMLGLAVGIDYALFVLSRHVRQLKTGMAAEASAARAVATAGSAVVFAGLTVVIALLGLLIVDIPFLSAMGIAAAVAVVIAVLTALTLVPALLGLLSGVLRRSLDRRSARRARKAAADTAVNDGAERRAGRPRFSERFFGAWVRGVTRRPLLTVVLVLAAVGAISLPALDLRLGLPDAGSQAEGTQTRVTHDLVAEHLGPGHNGSLVLTGPVPPVEDPVGFVLQLGARVSDLDGVAAVPVATPNADGTALLLSIVPVAAPDSEQTRVLVDDLRALADQWQDEWGVDLSVTGFTAAGIDVSTLLGEALLPYIAFIVVLSLLLLTIVFRSIWVPIKATIGFLLTIGSALGAVSLVYSWGWFAGPLGVDPSAPVISFMPIIVLGVLFGLAMDYEVFLVSTMKEQIAHGATALTAVRQGFRQSAPVVTAAALIMFAVFATFVPAADSTIQPIAVALAVGVFVDAFVVRMTFVPAVLALLGERAWRMPARLERLVPSLDIEGAALRRSLAVTEGSEAVTVSSVGDSRRTTA